MEIYVLSDRRLASLDAWQQAVDADGFGLRFLGEIPIETIRGYLPAQWKEKPAGFECSHWNASELMREYPEVNFGRLWSHALALRWGADLNACQGANMAATAYANATEGVVFDPEAGALFSPAQAAARVREMEKLLPSIEAALKDIGR